MATSFFPSRRIHCEKCSTRQVSVGKKEETKKETQYYHRGVVAHLVGFDLPIVLDIEMLEPGEGEITAAKRLLERVLKRYGRFFDVVLGDALYWEEPLFSLCRKHGKHLLAVLKKNNPALLTDAEALLTGEPDLELQNEEGRHIRCWDQEGFTSGSVDSAVRVLRSEETWSERRHGPRGKPEKWVQVPKVSHWFWATDIPQSVMSARQLIQAGHERWRIENTIFNTLSQHWGLDHNFHHQPTAIVNFLLILFIAHTLVACFYHRNLKKPARRIHSSLISVTREIFRGLASLKARDIPWRLARGSPAGKTA